MLSGKTALVTGSNGGIGRAIVDAFIKNGANLICAIRKTDTEFSDYLSKIQKKPNQTVELLEFDLENEAKCKKYEKLFFLINSLIFL